MPILPVTYSVSNTSKQAPNPSVSHTPSCSDPTCPFSRTTTCHRHQSHVNNLQWLVTNQKALNISSIIPHPPPKKKKKGSRLQQWEGSCVSVDTVRSPSPAPVVFQLVALGALLPGLGCLQVRGLLRWVGAPRAWMLLST